MHKAGVTLIPLSIFLIAVLSACGDPEGESTPLDVSNATSGGGAGVGSGAGEGGGNGGSGATGGGGEGGGGGEEWAPCADTINPGDSFEDAFAQLSDGETLCLNDGVYEQMMEVPSNKHVRAVNIGMADLEGGGVLGEEWNGAVLFLSGDNSSAQGLRVRHAGPLSDACRVAGNNNTLRYMSCSHGGSYKHKLPLSLSGSGHLIEDSWFFGEGRYVVMCFLGDSMTLRRNIMRWDSTIAGEPNEPNAAMSNYACADMLWENNISLDYGEPETFMTHCGDICMSTTFDVGNQNVRYRGMMVVNHAASTGNNRAMMADSKAAGVQSLGLDIEDFYVRGVGAGAFSNSAYADATMGRCTMVDVPGQAGAVGGTPTTCQGDADISHRYVDGVLTDEPLFPFAYEDVAKVHMCAAEERQSDWCSHDGSLESYVLAN